MNEFELRYLFKMIEEGKFVFDLSGDRIYLTWSIRTTDPDSFIDFPFLEFFMKHVDAQQHSLSIVSFSWAGFEDYYEELAQVLDNYIEYPQ